MSMLVGEEKAVLRKVPMEKCYSEEKAKPETRS